MDHKIYLYDAASTVLRAKCDTHNSRLKHIALLGRLDGRAERRGRLPAPQRDGRRQHQAAVAAEERAVVDVVVFGWEVRGAAVLGRGGGRDKENRPAKERRKEMLDRKARAAHVTAGVSAQLATILREKLVMMSALPRLSRRAKRQGADGGTLEEFCHD